MAKEPAKPAATTTPAVDPTAGLTVRFEENGVVQVEELQRAVLSSTPAWATLAFLARERDATTGEFRAPRVSLRRYKRRAGRFVVDKHFTITNRAQGLALVAALSTWFADGGPGAGEADDDDDGS
ncbi:MAG: hypothetical protein Q8O67_23340 [Deltaproteobacteria bacterium]|nr:hypothetical protein [Deltaproteobacteria bacterium]